MAKFIEVHKGDAPYLLNLDDISSITAFGGETCFWHRDGDSSVYDDSFDTVRLMIGAAQGGIPMDTGGELLMGKAVLISIRPEWVEKIANGWKTIEVRKTKPYLETPFKCYIYCTNTRPFLVWGDVFRGDWFTEFTRLSGYGRTEADRIWDVFNGHVAGEFVCDRIETINPATEPYRIYDVDDDFVSKARLVDGALWDYGHGATLYGWHISKLEIYDTPKELNEFWFPPELYCEKERCGGCPYDQVADVNGEYSFDCEWKRPLTRPPQSWCYVEEQ